MDERDGYEGVAWLRARAGDGDALGAIFDLHQHRVYRHALRMLGSTHEAEEATATAFFELWRKRREVREVDGSVLPWLLVTTANICRNTTRSKRRYATLISSLRSSGASSSAEDDAFRSAELFAVVEPALADRLRDLPRSTLALFILTAVEGYSVAEAALTVGLSEGAAKTRLSRARAALRASNLGESLVRNIEGGTS